MSELIERLNALYVWPQSVADNHADILTPRQIKHLYEVGTVATEAADEIERLTAEVRRLDYSTTHTCWDECPRVACVQRREIEALTAELNGLKDALAQAGGTFERDDRD